MSNNNFSIEAFPLPAPPDTWALNGTYVSMLDRFTQRWLDKGYRWKFGVELNFSAQSIDADSPRDFAATSALGQHLQRIAPRLANSRALLVRAPEAATIHAARAACAERLIQAAGDGTVPERFFTATATTPEEVASEIVSYAEKLRSDDEDVVADGVRSLYLAQLHMLPLAQGGLADVIEPRFGNYLHAVGWFDYNEADCEVRLHPQPDYQRFIGTYHAALRTLGDSGIAMGVMAAPCYNHMHFSIEDVSSGINLMESEAPEHIELRRKLMQGLVSLIGRYPALYNDHDVADTHQIHAVSAGTSRARHLRQCPRTWEYRGNKGSEVLHLARDMALLMMGGYAGVYAETPEGTPYFGDLDIPACRKPLVTSPQVFAISGIRSTLEHSAVEADGTLKPDLDATYWNTGLLLRECGFAPDADATITLGQDAIDLKTADGWNALFGKIAVTDDGALRLPEGLPEDIADAFDGFRVSGYRTAFNVSLTKLALGLSVYQNAPRALRPKSLFARIAGEEDTAALKAFYEGYEGTKAAQLAARIATSAGHYLEDPDKEIGTLYANVWSQILSPSVLQIIFDAVGHAGSNKSKRWRIRRSTLAKRKSVITALAPVFNDAVDAEIAFAKAEGKATNALVAGLEDARRDIGNFTREPRALLLPAMQGTVEYAMEESDASAEIVQHFIRFHKNHVVAAFLLMASDTTVPLSHLRLRAEQSNGWFREAFELAEAAHPERAANERYKSHKVQLLEQHARAVDRVRDILNAFEAGKPASLRMPFKQSL